MNVRRPAMLAATVCASLLFSGAAEAHPGDHSQMTFAQAVDHLMSHPFHVGLFVLAFSVGLGIAYHRATRRAVCARKPEKRD